jgi:peptide/nickel transport system permease protein
MVANSRAFMKIRPQQRFRIRLQLIWRRLTDSWRTFKQSPLGVIGLILILLFGVMAIAHPILLKTVWPSGIYDPETGFDSSVFHPTLPASNHILGTDALGRDVLSMLLAATTPTFILGIMAAVSTAVVGTLLGAATAYFRGPIDLVLSRVSDAFLLLPAPLLMVIVGSRYDDILPAQLGLLYGVVAGAGNAAIVMRSHALKILALPYVDVSRQAGGGASHIIFRHLLPHMLPLAAVQMTIAVTGAVVADGFISFLGFSRVITNWGTMIYNTLVYASVFALDSPLWHALVPPSLALSLFALGFYLVSRGLHRVADPRLRT